MTEQNTNTSKAGTTESTRKPGIFGRIFQKLDDSIKQKAEKQSRQSCCGDKDDKGNKCC